QSFGICDRCGLQYTHATLRWQFEWAGSELTNRRILVCDSGCMDVPNPQLRTAILGPDPLPIQNARPEQDRGPPMQTYPLRHKITRNVRQNDGSIIVTENDPGTAPDSSTGMPIPP